MNTYSQHQRRDLVARMVKSRAVHSQDELLQLLSKNGVRVTQPTLSRDIAELGLVKTQVGYTLPSDLAAGADEASFTSQERREEKLARAIREFVLEMQKAGTLVVIRTTVAAAQPVARAIDESGLAEVAGTIGGDDTIFVATIGESAAERLLKRFRSYLPTPRSTRRTRP
ncbi:MAG TPA: ArgR family transcriptional regulator [Thermoanaerobaculia bacterium]|nr:ArgR family transcriptional regulator [Thermoanaerobaculia bacterium]